MKSRLGLWIPLVFVVVAVTAVVFTRRDVAEWFAVRALTQAGLGPASLSVETFGLDGLVIRDLSAADGAIAVQRIEARYAFPEILSGRLKSLAVGAPSVRASWQDGKVAIGNARFPSESSSSTAVAIDAISVENGTAALATPAGAVSLTFATDVARTADTWTGTLKVAGKGPGLALTADWTGALSTTDPTRSKGAGTVDLALDKFALSGLPKLDGRVRLSAKEGSDGTFSIDVTADSVAVATAGTWRLTPAGAELKLAQLDGTVTNLKSGDEIVSRDIKLTLQASSTHAQTIALAVGAVTPDIGLTVAPFMLYPESTKIGFSIPVLAVTGTDAGVRVRADKAIVVHDFAGVEVSTIDVVWNGTDARGTGTAQLVAGPDKSITGLATRAAPGIKAVAAFSADTRGVIVSGDLRTAKDADVGDFSFALPPGKPWQAEIAFDTLTFGASALAWSDLFAPLVDLQETSGELTLRAKLHGTADGIDGSASLRVQDLSFTLAQVPFTDVDAKIDLEHIASLSGPGEHSITFKQIGAAVPLENGAITVHFPGDNAMTIDRIAATIAGGRIEGGSQTIRRDDPKPALALRISGVDLQRLLAAVDISGLEGQGLIGGRFPLALDQTALLLQDGLLNSSQGIIRYNPAEVPAAISAGGPVVAQALANFHYSDLKATLNGNLMENVVIGISLKGKNPDLFNGYPVEFNLNLEGPLARIAATGLASSSIAGEIGARDIQIPVNGDGVTKPPQ